MPILRLTWKTQREARVCPICASLEGYTWTFLSGARNPPQTLVARGRTVWNLMSFHSTAHGYQRFNCRCGLILKVDLTDVNKFAKALRRALT